MLFLGGFNGQGQKHHAQTPTRETTITQSHAPTDLEEKNTSPPQTLQRTNRRTTRPPSLSTNKLPPPAPTSLPPPLLSRLRPLPLLLHRDAELVEGCGDFGVVRPRIIRLDLASTPDILAFVHNPLSLLWFYDKSCRLELNYFCKLKFKTRERELQ